MSSQQPPPAPLPPVVAPGGWYTKQQVLFNLGIGNRTWERWIAAGMETSQPGTKEIFVSAAELDRMLKLPPELLPPAYKSPYAEKNAARNRKRLGAS